MRSPNRSTRPARSFGRLAGSHRSRHCVGRTRGKEGRDQRRPCLSGSTLGGAAIPGRTGQGFDTKVGSTTGEDGFPRTRSQGKKGQGPGRGDLLVCWSRRAVPWRFAAAISDRVDVLPPTVRRGILSVGAGSHSTPPCAVPSLLPFGPTLTNPTPAPPELALTLAQLRREAKMYASLTPCRRTPIDRDLVRAFPTPAGSAGLQARSASSPVPPSRRCSLAVHPTCVLRSVVPQPGRRLVADPRCHHDLSSPESPPAEPSGPKDCHAMVAVDLAASPLLC